VAFLWLIIQLSLLWSHSNGVFWDQLCNCCGLFAHSCLNWPHQRLLLTCSQAITLHFSAAAAAMKWIKPRQIEETLTLKTCKMTTNRSQSEEIHSGLPSDRVNQHTIHWMPLMTQLWMNINWVDIWFHSGNPSCIYQSVDT